MQSKSDIQFPFNVIRILHDQMGENPNLIEPLEIDSIKGCPFKTYLFLNVTKWTMKLSYQDTLSCFVQLKHIYQTDSDMLAVNFKMF